MLFVDGMQGVINHNETIQWLYTLSGSLVSSSVPLSVAVPMCCPLGGSPHTSPSGWAWCLPALRLVGCCSQKSPSVPRQM